MELGSPDLFGVHGPLAQAGDAVYTPDWCVNDMVGHFKPKGRILRTVQGRGALSCDACRRAHSGARSSKDAIFFAWSEPVDWIMTNPPYSLMREFLRHSISLAENIVFLVPAKNMFSGYGTVREPSGWGGMSAIRWYGTGARLNFPMGNAIAAIHWKKGHQGVIAESFYEDDVSPIMRAAE